MDLLFFVRCCHHVSPGYCVSSSSNEISLLYPNGVLWLVHFDPRCSCERGGKVVLKGVRWYKTSFSFPCRVFLSSQSTHMEFNSTLQSKSIHQCLISICGELSLAFSLFCFGFKISVLKAKTIQSKNLFCELRWPPCKVIALQVVEYLCGVDTSKSGLFTAMAAVSFLSS